MASPGKVYRSSPQALAGLIGSGLAMAAVLFSISTWGNRVVPEAMNEPLLRLLAFNAPLVVGCLLVLVVLILAYAGSGKEIRLTSEGMSYTHHGRAVVIPWDLMVLIKPNLNSSNPLTSALVSDGRRFVRIEKALYPEFDSLVATLDERRRGRQSKKPRL